MLLLGLAQLAQAAVVPVTTTVDAAVATANPGDTIQIPIGTFLETPITVNKDLIFEGAGCGQTTVVGGGLDVFVVSGATVSFRNLTITTNASSQGIDATNSDLSLQSVCMEGLGGSGMSGGAIRAVDSALTMSSSQFGNNTADLGGAVFTARTPMLVDGGSFTNNYASRDGGAVYANGDRVKVVGAVFAGNRTPGGGGAMWLYRAAPPSGPDVSSLTDCQFVDNHAEEGNGGAILMSETELEIRGGVFQSNEAMYRGGAIASLAVARDLRVDSTSFIGNISGTQGGALMVRNVMGDEPSVDIVDATFQGNTTVREGGAISFEWLGRTEIERTVFLDNQATLPSSQGGAFRSKNVRSIDISDSYFCGNLGNNGTAYAAHNTFDNEWWSNNIALFNGNGSHRHSTLTMYGDAQYVVEASTFSHNSGTQSSGVYAGSPSATGSWTVDSNVFADQTSAVLYALTPISEFTNNNLFFNAPVLVAGPWPAPTPIVANPGLNLTVGQCTGYTAADLTSAVSGHGADASLVPLP